MNPEFPVSSLMSRDVIFVQPGTPITEIHQIFEANRFHHLPVVSHGRIVGMISRPDYAKVRYMLVVTWSGSVELNASYDQLTAEDIMSTQVLHIEPGDTIGLAADIFLANTIHALPVIEDNELVGIITSHDLLKHAYDAVTMMQS